MSSKSSVVSRTRRGFALPSRRLAVAAVTLAAAAAARAAVTPIAGISGWNQDYVVEVGATDATAATSSAFDVPNNYIFYQNGLTGSGGGGLPSTGSFTSNSSAGTTFQFQPYTANNALALGANAGGTLTLATPGQFSALSFLTDSANGAATVGYTLNYSNAPSVTGSFVAKDWFGGTPFALTSIGRAKRTAPIGGFEQNSATSGNPRMYEVDLTGLNATGNLTSISFNQTTTTTGTLAAVWAVSGTASTIYTYTGTDPSTPGTFDTTSVNFTSNGSAAAFANGTNANFDDTATGPTTVAVAAAGVSPASVTFANSGKSYTLTGGPIGGTSTLSVTGGGTVTLNNANTYTGATTVANGTLVVGSTGAVNGSSVAVSGGATLTVQTGGQLAAGVAVADNGTVNFNNPTRVVGALTGTGTVNVNNTALTVGAGTTFTGTFAGTGANSLNVAGGSIAFASQPSMATFAGGISVVAGGTVVLNDGSGQLGLTNAGQPITLASAGGTVTSPAFSGVTFAGNLAATGTAATALTVGNSSSFTLAGPLTGSAPVRVTAAGSSTLTFAGANTNTGEVQVVGGANLLTDQLTVNFAANNAFSRQSGLSLASGGTGQLNVDLAGYSQSVAYLTGPGSSNLSITNNGGPATLTIANGNTSAGAAANVGTSITGNLSVVKTGAGNQVVTGANSYGGTTTITGGTLTAANAQAFGSNPVTLNGGTLGLVGPAAQTFTGFAGYQVNRAAGTATTVGGVSADAKTLNLTDGNTGEGIAGFTPAAVPVGTTGGFTASFTWNHANLNASPYSVADGLTFILQNNASTAVGLGGGGLGYKGLGNSIAIALDTYSGYSTGFGTGFGSNGVLPANNTFLSIAPIVIQNENIAVTLAYDGPSKTLVETLAGQDGSGNATGHTYTHSYTGIDLSALLGGNAAYVGFGGGTGGVAINQSVTNFSFTTTAGLSGPGSIANAVLAAAGTQSSISMATTASLTASGVGPITLGAGSTVTLVSTGIARGVLSTPSLTFGNASNGSISGRIDVAGNDLDVQGGDPTALTAAVTAGYANGTFNGPGGIISSAAAANARHTTAVGVIVNNDGGTELYGSGTALGLFDRSNPGANDVLVKYTYFGDANLDGKVDGTDYGRLDVGYAAGGSLTGWYNGDFNYDAKVDGSDYTLIDNAFNLQSGVLAVTATSGAAPAGIVAAATAEVAAAAAVPEPTSVGLLAVAAVGLVGRRRRR